MHFNNADVVEKLKNSCGKTTGILNVRNYFHHIRSLDPAAETAGNTLAIHLRADVVLDPKNAINDSHVCSKST
jgi:hypothetical protein